MDESSMAVVREIEAVGTARGQTKVPVTVTACGLVSRGALAQRDLSRRRSGWLRHRLQEMRRMEEDDPGAIVDAAEHKQDVLLLKGLLKNANRRRRDKEERQRIFDLKTELKAGVSVFHVFFLVNCTSLD